MVIDVLRGVWLGIGLVFLASLAAWVLAAGLLVAVLIVVWISRRSPAAVRELFRHAVAAGSSPALLHTGRRDRGAARVGAALRELRAADPSFDYNAFLDGARVAVAAYAVAQMAADDGLLRRITTPGFWQTHHGKAITERTTPRQRDRSSRPRGVNLQRLLDVSWRQPVLQSVVLGERGLDRITVRLASVWVGFGLQHRIDMATQFDWDFVRPAGAKTDRGTVLLSVACASCGAAFRSQIEDACAYCHASRADAQGGWRLDRNYLVMETG